MVVYTEKYDKDKKKPGKLICRTDKSTDGQSGNLKSPSTLLIGD